MATSTELERSKATHDANEKDAITITTPAKSDASSSTYTSRSSLRDAYTEDVEKGLTQAVAQPVPPTTPSVSSVQPDLGVEFFGTRVYDYLNHVVFTTYRQLWLAIVTANMIAIIWVLARKSHLKDLPLSDAANAAVSNLLVAILVRQDYMKNLMYHTCWSTPHSAPLWLRRRLCLVYENGGVHSGAAVSALLWFFVFTGFLWTGFARGSFSDAAVLTFDCALAVLLLGIVICALPQVRRRHHNVFENFHRWAGWAGIALFWPALVCFARDGAQTPGSNTSIGFSLVKLPAFWMLIVISLHAIYPWVLLRKVAVVKIERLSDHAIRMYFSPKEKVPPLHGVAISDKPLHEWHGFAAIPDLDGSEGGSTSSIISKAGDWTSKQIESPAPYIYMRGIHATGVLAMAQIFRSVVVMATGSGIGPCMAVFNQMPNTKVRIIWSTPSPRAIFGDKICNLVLKQDPHAIIWDTRKDGKRPDLVKMAYDTYHEANAEAVFFISNRNLTRKTISALKKKGVAAYAPVFDS